mmetsp:Transcript_10912/g.49603  ORF Transcript_10912/g.49603 Transcript_10912/m.49603 type:complete len:358 (+) Transcript_10912:144-1217(+)
MYRNRLKAVLLRHWLQDLFGLAFASASAFCLSLGLGLSVVRSRVQEHATLVGDLGGVPAADILVEHLGSHEHVLHGGDLGGIPVADRRVFTGAAVSAAAALGLGLAAVEAGGHRAEAVFHGGLARGAVGEGIDVGLDLGLDLGDAQALVAVLSTAVEPAVPEKLSGFLGAAHLPRMQRATLGAVDGSLDDLDNLVGLVVDGGAGILAGVLVRDGDHAVVLAGALLEHGVLKLGRSGGLSLSLGLRSRCSLVRAEQVVLVVVLARRVRLGVAVANSFACTLLPDRPAHDVCVRALPLKSLGPSNLFLNTCSTLCSASPSSPAAADLVLDDKNSTPGEYGASVVLGAWFAPAQLAPLTV